METSQEEMNAMNYDTNSEETYAAVELLEVLNEQMNEDHVRVVGGLKWGPAMDSGFLEPPEKTDHGQCCTRNPEGNNVCEEMTDMPEV